MMSSVLRMTVSKLHIRDVALLVNCSLARRCLKPLTFHPKSKHLDMFWECEQGFSLVLSHRKETNTVWLCYLSSVDSTEYQLLGDTLDPEAVRECIVALETLLDNHV
jgi:hypothetical protein